MKPKIRIRDGITNLGGIDLKTLENQKIVKAGRLDLKKLRENYDLLQEISLRETADLDGKARAEFIKLNKDLILQIAAARLGREEEVLKQDRNAKKNYQLFKLLKEADFEEVRSFWADNPRMDLDPLIEKLIILFESRLWGKISQKSERRLKRYSFAAWQDMLDIFLKYPLTVISVPNEAFAKICDGLIKKFEKAIELFNLRQANPEIYSFSNKQILQMVTSPGRIRLILQKTREYSTLPPKLRPHISRIVKIGLSAGPEERFEFLDGEIKKAPESISPMLVLATLKNFQGKIAQYRRLLKAGKDINLSSSAAIAMLSPGISLNQIRKDVKVGKDIGLTVSLAVRMRQAGATIEDIRGDVEAGKDIGLTAYLAVTMRQAGATIEDIRKDIEAGKDIGLRAYSAVRMRQAGATIKDIREDIEAGKDIGLRAYSAVIMREAKITIEDIREDVKAGKDIGLTAYLAVIMRQAGISLKEIKTFIREIGFKLSTAKAVLFLTNKHRKRIIPRIYDFMRQLTTLRSKYDEKIKEGRIPKYLIEAALLMECLSPDEYDFIQIHKVIEEEILYSEKPPGKLFMDKYFPWYLKLAGLYFGELPLIIGKRYFEISTEVFAAARLSDLIFEGMPLGERIEEPSVPLPSDLVIIKDIIEKARSILSPGEYAKLITWYSENEKGEPPSDIQKLVLRIREELELEIEEEEI